MARDTQKLEIFYEVLQEILKRDYKEMEIVALMFKIPAQQNLQILIDNPKMSEKQYLSKLRKMAKV